jgi:hypothetical protein
LLKHIGRGSSDPGSFAFFAVWLKAALVGAGSLAVTCLSGSLVISTGWLEISLFSVN